MKVFRLNEYDWIYAESEEQALEWYLEQTGLDKEEAYDDHYFEEIDPNVGTTLVHIDDLTLKELQMTQEMIRQGNNLLARKTYAQVIESENLTAPCIIASTEY
ncbi:hypothetical protein [Paucisalibacillus globulus]|uniref:hypothetical protein n=1 Tax=Paucisalibacillus globulus TaxID=351095 RepID=UPI0003F61FA3|nr:hypothetical protein [Paucisalibacillus globulus]